MRSLFTFICLSFFISSAFAQNKDAKANTPDPDKVTQTVEVSCGKCKLGLPGNTCDLAVRIDDKSYYVDGAEMDNFGDAHAHDGMCNAIRKAEVQGELIKDRYKVSYIKLLPAAKKEKKKKN